LSVWGRFFSDPAPAAQTAGRRLCLGVCFSAEKAWNVIFWQKNISQAREMKKIDTVRGRRYPSLERTDEQT
jgi:hypothetical protein